MLRTEKKEKESRAKSNNENVANQFVLLKACRKNAIDLIKEAEILYKHRCYQRAFTLAYTANEEISKGQIVADYISRVASKEELKDAFKNHKIKAAYNNLKVEIGEIVKTGKKFEHNGKVLDIFTQDNMLRYDLAESTGMFTERNRSMYVDYEGDYKAIVPKDNFNAKKAKGLISSVKKRLSEIHFAENLNGRIGTKALIK